MRLFRCGGCCRKKEWILQQSCGPPEPSGTVEKEARLAHKIPHPSQKLLCGFDSSFS